MANHELTSAVLFTPGRASYITTGPDGTFNLNLTEAATNRAETAAQLFDDQFHTTAQFAGGHPGIAQDWPPEHRPLAGHGEADLLAEPLEERLRTAGWTPGHIAERVKRQSESDNSIGDVLISIERGLLNPDDFHRTVPDHGIDLVAGVLHGIRFTSILTKGLDIDPKLIRRAKIHDVYGTPATEFRTRELAPIALAKEYAAIALTRFVLKDVRPGNIEDLRKAEHRFNTIAATK